MIRKYCKNTRFLLEQCCCLATLKIVHIMSCGIYRSEILNHYLIKVDSQIFSYFDLALTSRNVVSSLFLSFDRI